MLLGEGASLSKPFGTHNAGAAFLPHRRVTRVRRPFKAHFQQQLGYAGNSATLCFPHV